MKFGVVGDELDRETSEVDELTTVLEGGGKRKADVLDAANVDMWMSTEVVRDNYVLHWNIGDIKNVASHGAIKSPLFRAGYHFQHIWEAEVTPTEVQGQMYFGVKVKLIAFHHWKDQSALDAGRQLKVSLDVSIVDKQAKVCDGLQGTDYIDQGGTVEWPQFLKVDDLDSVLQQNGDLRLLVSITIEMDTHLQGQGQEVTQGQEPPSKKTCTRQISKGHEVNDLENSKAFETTDLTWKRGDEEPDFEIITDEYGEERSFKVQKSVLAGNSFFKKHFESGPADEQASMDLPNILPAHMKMILDFIYYGNLDEHRIRNNPAHFFEYGALFEIPEIKEIAESVLADNITAANVLNFYSAAEELHGSKILAKVIDFVKNQPDQLSPYDRQVLEDELHLGEGQEVTDLVTFQHLDKPTDYEIFSFKVKFAVHKEVLAGKSPFFKNIFETGRLSQQKSLHFYTHHATPEVIKTMLQFIYTGSVSLHDLEMCWQNTEEVFRLAEYWELSEFKNRLAESLLQEYV